MPKSISPVEASDGNREILVDSDADEEGEEGDPVGEVCERIALEKEGAVVKRIVDPQLPSAQEVEEHCIRGHLPYRNWCPICVKAKGKSRDHKRDDGKERKIPEYLYD